MAVIGESHVELKPRWRVVIDVDDPRCAREIVIRAMADPQFRSVHVEEVPGAISPNDGHAGWIDPDSVRADDVLSNDLFLIERHVYVPNGSVVPHPQCDDCELPRGHLVHV